MATSALPLAPVRAALTGLIDYAGLFPPAQLGTVPALAEYAVAQSGLQGWMLGRFILPATRITDLRDAMPAAQPPVPVSVILDAGWRAAHMDELRGRVRIEAFEAALAPDAVDSCSGALKDAGMSDRPFYVEFGPARSERELYARMEMLALRGLRAKIRCGGITSGSVPPAQDLAAFVVCAASRGVAFKATAGLHHPLRHCDASSGLRIHGFLNLLIASALAHSGAAVEEVALVLECEERSRFDFDESGVRWENRRIGLGEIEAARRELFNSYGSCSFSEPVDDLKSLGLL